MTEWDAGVWRVGEQDDDRQEWGTVSATVVKKPLEQALFLGPAGQVLCLGSGDTHEEQIPFKNGAMRGIGAIDGEAYACGMGLQIFKRTGKKWTAFDEGIDKPKKGQVRGFEAIAGFSKKIFLQMDGTGKFGISMGRSGRKRTVLLKKVLTAICCAEDDEVYVAGQMGTLLKKTKTGWSQLKQKKFKEDIWSLAWYEGILYASTTSGVYRLQEDQLEEVSFGKESPKTFFHLSAADGVLWSIGAKDVLSFDGKKWKRID